MKLDRKDVEAIAKSRVNRAEGNKGTYWIIGALLVVVVGFFVGQIDINNGTAIGLVLCVLGFAIFLWYMYGLNKRQNVAKARLLKEWQQEEQQKKREQGQK